MVCFFFFKKKEKKFEFFLDILLRFKYGIVCVVNIDVRGNVFIYVIFKRVL